jgi:hypothetical protein
MYCVSASVLLLKVLAAHDQQFLMHQLLHGELHSLTLLHSSVQPVATSPVVVIVVVVARSVFSSLRCTFLYSLKCCYCYSFCMLPVTYTKLTCIAYYYFVLLLLVLSYTLHCCCCCCCCSCCHTLYSIASTAATVAASNSIVHWYYCICVYIYTSSIYMCICITSGYLPAYQLQTIVMSCSPQKLLQ